MRADERLAGQVGEAEPVHRFQRLAAPAARAAVDKVKKKAGSWAAYLARVFEVYPLTCPKCWLEMKSVAVILNDKELVRLLTHLRLPVEFPRFRPAAQASLYEHACGPPDEQCRQDPRVDYETTEPAPADDYVKRSSHSHAPGNNRAQGAFLKFKEIR